MKDLLLDDVNDFIRKVSDADRITVISHIYPDGDSTGSSVAMLRWLLSLGKDAYNVLLNPYPETLEFLISDDIKSRVIINSENPQRAKQVVEEAECIMCQDFNEKSRVGDLEGSTFSSKAPKILIDHHPGPESEAFSLCFSEPDISSTSELVYQILMKIPGMDGNARNLPPHVGEALMTGMTTDTNNFANSVFPTTLIMTSELLAAGVDRDMILDHLFQNHKLTRIRLMGHLLAHCLNVTPDGVAYMILNAETAQEYDVQEGDTDGFVNIPLGAAEVKMSILAKEKVDYFHISIRSKEGVSANMCSRLYFNGGGHERAAGGKVPFSKGITTVEQLEKYIEEVTHKFFEEQKQ